jgi:hypothetical protein
MLRSPVRLFIALAAILATATVAAQVYRWVDKDGKVHFSDQPPPSDAKGVSAKRIDAKPASGSTPAAAPKDGKVEPKALPAEAVKPESQKTLAEKAKDFEKRRADEAEASKKAADEAKVKAINQERCRDAQAFVRTLESGRPMSTTNAAGERVIMDEKARDAEVAKARSAAAEVCR